MANARTRFPEEVLKTATADGKSFDTALAAAVLTDAVQKYSPDQERDESGKWTSGGGTRNDGGVAGIAPYDREASGRLPMVKDFKKKEHAASKATEAANSFGNKLGLTKDPKKLRDAAKLYDKSSKAHADAAKAGRGIDKMPPSKRPYGYMDGNLERVHSKWAKEDGNIRDSLLREAASLG